MSLATAINNAVSSAFTAIDDLKISGIATYATAEVRDVNTQTYTSNKSSDIVNIVQYDFSAQEKADKNIMANDYKFLIQISELTQDVEDYVFIQIGVKKWSIKDIILKESSDSVVVYHMRLQDANTT